MNGTAGSATADLGTFGLGLGLGTGLGQELVNSSTTSISLFATTFLNDSKKKIDFSKSLWTV